MRKFNTAGVCLAERHYMIEPESRLPEARGLVDDLGYFVVHAPRQTGKSTTLMALAQALTAEGRYAALHFTCEVGEPFGSDVAAAERVVCSALRNKAKRMLPADLRPPPLQEDEPGLVLSTNLSAWAQACPKPLVLFFDEIDALRGDQPQDGAPSAEGRLRRAAWASCGVCPLRRSSAACASGAAAGVAPRDRCAMQPNLAP